jgi:hypothetical protein
VKVWMVFLAIWINKVTKERLKGSLESKYRLCSFLQILENLENVGEFDKNKVKENIDTFLRSINK